MSELVTIAERRDEKIKLTEREFEERFAALVANFESYVEEYESGAFESGLFEYQKPVMSDIREFLRDEAWPDSLRNDSSLRDRLTKGGYIVFPPSGGKTVLMAKSLEAFGIGRPPTPESKTRLRALILVPSKTALTQTTSTRDLEKGLKKYAPHLSITAYYQRVKDLSGDVVVMTYNAFRDQMEAGTLQEHHFDLIFSDEAHHTLGPKTATMLDEYRRGRLALDWTATPQLGSGKSLERKYGKPIHETEIRPFLKAGYGSGIQVLGFSTGTELIIKNNKQKEFSEADLKPIMYNKNRNQLIVDIAAQLVAEGQRGVINCIRGDGCYHAKHLAHLLNGAEIIDEETGLPRLVRAAAVGQFLSEKECDSILQGLEAGEYDVVTQIDKLTEAYDSAELAFGINAAPTLSPRVAIQRAGRLFRQHDDWPLKIGVEILDDARGRDGKRASRIPYTLWHVLGEESMEQGAVVANEKLKATLKNMGDAALQGAGMESGRTRPTRKRKLVMGLQDFSGQPAKGYGDYQHILVNEFRLIADEQLGPPPEGWPTLRSIMPQVRAKGVALAIDGISALLEKNDLCKLAKKNGRVAYYASPTALSFLENHNFLEIAPPDRRLLVEIVTELHTTRDVVRKIIEDENQKSNRLKGEMFLSRATMREHEHFDQTQFEIIKVAVEERKSRTAEESMIGASELETELEWSRTSIKFFLERHYGVEGEALISPRSGLVGIHYEHHVAELVRQHRAHKERVPKRAYTLEHLEQKLQISQDQILTIASIIGLKDCFKKGHYKDKTSAYHYTQFCDELTAELVEDEVERQKRETTREAPHAVQVTTQPEKAPRGYTDLLNYITEHDAHCQPNLIPALLRRAQGQSVPIWIDPSTSRRWVETTVAEAVANLIKQYPVALKGMGNPEEIGILYNLEAPLVHKLATELVNSMEGHAGWYRTRGVEGMPGELTIHYGKYLTERLNRELEQQKLRGRLGLLKHRLRRN